MTLRPGDDPPRRDGAKRRLRWAAWIAAVWIAAACALGALSGAARAQQAPSPAPTAARTTQSGVYTTQQAARGRDVYAGACTACHTPAAHSGGVFTNTWTGRSVWDLYDFIAGSMPQTDPGGLSPEEYVQVVAYLLQINRMPAGREVLSPDRAMLSTIRFDTATARPGRAPDR
ncbi:MAG TPA: cytochrome c [Gemmatimonadaceae bacterium]|nr:cytochrome c [Gemmatimonadaceae bacterium]